MTRYELDGRAVIVTGTEAGIGEACARALAISAPTPMRRTMMSATASPTTTPSATSRARRPRSPNESPV